MKTAYRIFILLVIAAACFWLAHNPVTPDSSEVFSTFADPVRSRFAEYEGGVARGNLDERQMLIYDVMYWAAENTARSVTVPVGGYSESDIETALFSLLTDCPQFFWVDFAGCAYAFDDRGTTITFRYHFSDEERQRMLGELESAVDRIVSEVNSHGFSNEYDKAVYVHDYIAANCEYDRSLSLSVPVMHTAYGALVSKTAVCDGFAHAYQLVAQRLGIECHYIYGEANGPNGIEGHAWNIIKLDGTYTAVDLTWNSIDSHLFEELAAAGGITSHIYFGVSQNELKKTHRMDEHFIYPVPTAMDMSWFVRRGVSGVSVDAIADSASDILIANMEKSTPYVEIQLTDIDMFNEFMETYDGSIIDAANVKLRESGRAERFSNEMSCFATQQDRGVILILGTVFIDEDGTE